MGKPIPLDTDWLRAHPLPAPDDDADKNERGRVLVIGGSRAVPGGIGLTAEAALRAGAGKVRVATVESAAIALGVALPEIGVLGLDEDASGDIAGGGGSELDALLGGNDAVVAGPAMSDPHAAGLLVDRLLDNVGSKTTVVLDAAALMCLTPAQAAQAAQAAQLRERGKPLVLTPHVGEMASLLQSEVCEIERDRPAAVIEAARLINAVCLLKGATSLIATPDGELFEFAGGGVGLATGGSGDVLAGIAGGLFARGADPLRGLLWAVWLHGESGRLCGAEIGEIGYLARELLPHIPRLMGGLRGKSS